MSENTSKEFQARCFLLRQEQMLQNLQESGIANPADTFALNKVLDFSTVHRALNQEFLAAINRIPEYLRMHYPALYQEPDCSHPRIPITWRLMAKAMLMDNLAVDYEVQYERDTDCIKTVVEEELGKRKPGAQV